MKYKLKEGVERFTFQGQVITGSRRVSEDDPLYRAFPGRFELADAPAPVPSPEPEPGPKPQSQSDLGRAIYEDSDFNS